MYKLDAESQSHRYPTAELRRIAGYQQWIIACAVGQVAVWLLMGFIDLVTHSSYSGPGVLAFVLTLATSVGGAFCVFLVNLRIRNFLVASMMAAATLIPVLGLLAMMAVNGVISRVLMEHGIIVGVFGADIDSIDDSSGWFDSDEEDLGW